ncbi:MAG: hypothetical protein B7Z75_13025 [Acidocella sp. 20-57-95]|nr:MAG: hypothetical protein B7Z75_13025 [Acidocella sp. 20-57-95]OYV62409.1 MAG: hypothetical protein B7Z71_01300 [Acidocella sp. 21-58-7]HQT65044.1 polysaccharide biosynthesis tyrosine autokinase [Acidocella sp.]HQU03479.1 polysaccharide biosynthesis tyrosine autokinase [Acidocella sp.]
MSLSLTAPPVQATPLPEQLIMLRRHLRLIIATSCALPLIAALVLALTPASYTATGVLIYNAPAPAPGIAASAQDADALIASQSAVITSLPALRSLASQLNLATRPEFNPPPAWYWPTTTPQDPDHIALAAAKALTVTIPPNSRLLNISFTSTDPALSAAAANLAIQLYLTTTRDNAFKNLQDSQTWLQSREADVQSDLAVTETKLAAARATAGVVTGMQGTLSAETASRIAAALVDSQSTLAMAQARLKSAASGNQAAANAAIGPNLLLLRKEQADFSAQVQALSRQYGPGYPDLAAAQASLTAITAEINAETAREIDAARADVAADQAQVASLTASLATARNQSHTEDSQSAPIQALTSQADSDRAMLNALAVQADQMAQQAVQNRALVSIISAATPPSQHRPTHAALILAAAAFLGACLGILLAGLAEALDTSFRSGHAAQTETGLPCLAIIPTTPKPQDAALDAPFSLYGEQLRAIRTALTLHSARLLAITAARPGEGKTTLTVALGRSLAAAGLNVLVIDADIRQPSFELAFSARNAVGLTDHLAGLATLATITQKDYRGTLNFITAGTQTADALTLFLSPKFPALLAQLRKTYDYILIDVPPAFALSETRILARNADATLFCIRWGHTPRRVVQAALAMLTQANVQLAGIILTRVDAKTHRRSGFADAEMYQPAYGGYFRPRDITAPSQQRMKPLS